MKNSDSAEEWNEKGIEYLKKLRYQEAIDAYETALRIKPELSIDPLYAEAWNTRGLIFLVKGNYVEALKNFEIALKIDPDFELSKTNKKIACRRLGLPENGHFSENPPPFDVIPDTPKINTILRVSDAQKKEEVWDEEQLKVIQADPTLRLLVDAGPGTGKTAVACARVAWLIREHNIRPKSIIIISFTRAAVHEIRNRLSEFLKKENLDPDDARSVTISTIDSYAFAIRKGHDGKFISGSFDENIRQLTEDLETGATGAGSHLEKHIRHLIIDESQDIVGWRSELLAVFLKNISPDCGVTVFSDEAQAIYGFSENGIHSGSIPLVERIRNCHDPEFLETSLKTVYRTENNQMISLFTDTRVKVMKNENTMEEYSSVLKDIFQKSQKMASDVTSPDLDRKDNCFILFRWRVNILEASQARQTRPHRIRLPNLPYCIEPWIGACFLDYHEILLNKKDFLDLWEERVQKNNLAKISPESAWSDLVHCSGTDRAGKNIDLGNLRKNLDVPKPPVEFSFPDIGYCGPIMGTIHASKGRETDEVHLWVSDTPWERDIGEEIRVLFVGATRARKNLYVRISKNVFAKYLDSDDGDIGGARVYLKRSGKNPVVNIEIGRSGDIVAESVAGKAFFTSSEAAEIQKTLLLLGYNLVNCKALYNSDGNHFRIQTGLKSATVAVLSAAFMNDFKTIQSKSGFFAALSPEKVFGLRVFGTRTIALRPGSPELSILNEPWSKSGFMLAPVVFGFPEFVTKNV